MICVYIFKADKPLQVKGIMEDDYIHIFFSILFRSNDKHFCSIENA